MRVFGITLRLFTSMSCLCGVVYPLLVTVIGRGIFPYESRGTLLYRRGELVGSSLIGQEFRDPDYFWSRPSATSPVPYNAASSGGSNLAPTNPALNERVGKRMTFLREGGIADGVAIPVDLVTASASGLDPHISPAAALLQIPRISRVRGISPDILTQLVAQHTEARQLGFLGEPRVNVLGLNLALDSVLNR